MFKTSALTLFVCITLLGQSMTSTADNTNSQITSTSGKESAKQYLIQAKQQEKRQVSNAIKYAKIAVKRAEFQKDIHLQVEGLYYLSHLSKKQGNPYFVQLYLAKIEPLLDKLNNVPLKVEVLLAIADSKSALDKFEASILLTNNVIEIAQYHNNEQWLYDSHRQKAVTLKRAKRYQESLQQYLLADKYAQALANTYKIQSYNELGVINKYLNKHHVRIQVLKAGIKFIKSLNDQVDLPQFLIHLAQAQRQISDYAHAIINASDALALAQKTNNNALSADACIVLSRVYRRISRYEDALRYSLQSMSINKDEGNINGLAAATNATGLIYIHLNEEEKAAQLFKKVLELPAKEINPKYLAASLRELGRYYYRHNKNEQGLTLSHQSFELYQKIPSIKGSASVKKTIGQLYFQMGDHRKAIESFNSAIQDSETIGDKWSIAENLILLSHVTLKSDRNSARDLAIKALSIAKDIKARLVSDHAYDVLIKIENQAGNTKGIQFYKNEKSYNLSEINDEKLQLIETNKLILNTIFSK